MDVLGIVFAAQAKQHAGVPLLEHKLLKDLVVLIQPYAFRTILAADALPKRIIAVESGHLIPAGADGMKPTRNHSAEGGKKLGSIRHVPKLVRVRIVIIRYGIQPLERCRG